MDGDDELEANFRKLVAAVRVAAWKTFSPDANNLIPFFTIIAGLHDGRGRKDDRVWNAETC
jgi:hypothetical protein